MNKKVADIEIVKHVKTGKYFVLLDEYHEHYQLINPNGETVSVPISFFSEDNEIGVAEELADKITPEQMVAHQKRAQELEERSKREQFAEKAQEDIRRVERATPKVYEAQRTPKRERPPARERTGIEGSWTGPTLCFYRHQIDRLAPKEKFRITVHGTGEFVISKTDFQNVFSDVVLSAAYKADGYFAYSDIPEKAMRFLTKRI